MSTAVGITRVRILTARRARLLTSVQISEKLLMALLWFSMQFVVIIENKKNQKRIMLHDDGH
jgi:hypothetical protein